MRRLASKVGYRGEERRGEEGWQGDCRLAYREATGEVEEADHTCGEWK
jgi:hypothetical protein